jgi:hypothetical protein
MTKKEWIEGGLVILGVGFIIWGTIYLVMNVVGWAYCVAVGNRETVALYYAPDFVRIVAANILQCAAGSLLIKKNRQIAGYVDRFSQNG